MFIPFKDSYGCSKNQSEYALAYAMVAVFEGLPQPALKRETFAPGFVSDLGGLNIRPAIVNLIFET